MAKGKVSTTAWTQHFLKMARGGLPIEDTYIVTQRGRGLGRSAFQRTSYKVRELSPSRPLPPVTVVSPVAQGIQQAKAKIPIKGQSTKTSKVSKTKDKKKKGGEKKKKKKKDKKKKDTKKKK